MTAGPDALYSLAFSPDGKTIVTASGNGTARLWNVATQRRIGAAMAVGDDLDSLDSIAFSPDGKLLATATVGGTVKLWNLATNQQIGVAMIVPSVTAVAFSPDDKTLATASNGTTANERGYGCGTWLPDVSSARS
jgi:WD40 repeat protein